jgi:hypothetical protein
MPCSGVSEGLERGPGISSRSGVRYWDIRGERLNQAIRVDSSNLFVTDSVDEHEFGLEAISECEMVRMSKTKPTITTPGDSYEYCRRKGASPFKVTKPHRAYGKGKPMELRDV